MSAFIVSDDHIDAIMTFALDKRVSFYNPDAMPRPERVQIDSDNVEEIGRILLDENVRSVGHRYDGRIDDDERNTASAYRFRRYGEPLSAVQVIKALHCLDYQCCETDDWQGSLAWRIVQEIMSTATHALPGYDGAQWEIERSPNSPEVISLTDLAKRR